MGRKSMSVALWAGALLQICTSAFADTPALSASISPPSASSSVETRPSNNATTSGAENNAPPGQSSSGTPFGTSPSANTQALPKQILKTGIDLSSSEISANSLQLANNIQLSPVLERIQSLRGKISALPSGAERSDARLDLLEARSQALQIICRTSLEVDFVMAEMTAEQNVYSEILSTFTNDRDKLVARINAASFISNGVLWAVCEGLSIPTHTRGVFAVPSGITGIAAGLVPSFASMYTLKAVNGKRKTSEVEPNMLAKLFNYPTNPEIEYPKSVWLYLNEAPADGSSPKTRRQQMIHRWIADANIPGFTGHDTKTLDILTASFAQKKGLSIATLTTRQVMLQQLSAEVSKMKRMLLELSMVAQGEKQLTVASEKRSLPIAERPRPEPLPIATHPNTDIGAELTRQVMNGLNVP